MLKATPKGFSVSVHTSVYNHNLKERRPRPYSRAGRWPCWCLRWEDSHDLFITWCRIRKGKQDFAYRFCSWTKLIADRSVREPRYYCTIKYLEVVQGSSWAKVLSFLFTRYFMITILPHSQTEHCSSSPGTCQVLKHQTTGHQLEPATRKEVSPRWLLSKLPSAGSSQGRSTG